MPSVSSALLPCLGALLLAGSVTAQDCGDAGEDEGGAVCRKQREEFHAYTAAHSRPYAPGSGEFKERFALFVQRRAEIDAQNGRADRKWTAAVNKLSDRTPEELQRLRGRPAERRAPSADKQAGALGALQLGARRAALPASATWTHLRTAQAIQDQGGCGSCWAFAAATVLEAHSEIYRDGRSFSKQELVSCVENPRHCGGSGGCNGATIELAFEYTMASGLRTEHEFPYSASDRPCPAPGAPASLLQAGEGAAAFGMMNWTRLPENSLFPLKQALVEWGPVAVSISAGGSWNYYDSGIMDSCVRDAVVDHAVVLIAYGEEGGTKYWQLQNSWGPDWGEGGRIRILRREDEEEAAYCGIDHQPELGSGCDGGPPEVEVCGSCGILYDAVIPQFEGQSWMARMMQARREMSADL